VLSACLGTSAHLTCRRRAAMVMIYEATGHDGIPPCGQLCCALQLQSQPSLHFRQSQTLQSDIPLVRIHSLANHLKSVHFCLYSLFASLKSARKYSIGPTAFIRWFFLLKRFFHHKCSVVSLCFQLICHFTEPINHIPSTRQNVSTFAETLNMRTLEWVRVTLAKCNHETARSQ